MNYAKEAAILSRVNATLVNSRKRITNTKADEHLRNAFSSVNQAQAALLLERKAQEAADAQVDA